MWKKLNDRKGSILIESMTGMMIISVVIITIVPLISFMFSQISMKKREVEVWRFFQDVAIESREDSSEMESQIRQSDGVFLEARAKNNHRTIIVESNTSKRTKVYYVELLQIE